MLLIMVITLLLQSMVTSAISPPFINGQNASLVLGQPDFTSNSFFLGASGMESPSDIAIDPRTGKVFVADSGHDRVLRFASLTALTNGAAAEGVLGQSSLTSYHAPGSPMPNGMFNPDDVAIDSDGRLWVADRGNNRVLRFDDAVNKVDGANADGVLGQPNFTSNSPTLTQSGMNQPDGVAVDSTGRLWVSEYINHRILRFDNVVNKTNGANADGVLGQPNFTSNTPTLTQNGMTYPSGIAVDSSGRLWVADEINIRVLWFDNAASKANGANADGVLGQPDFTSNSWSTTQSAMNDPKDVAIDSSERLWVVDYANNRVLWFDNAASKANGTNADGVLGQPDFTSSTRATSQNGMSGPVGLAVDSADRLWVADSFNTRVLLFVGQTAPITTPTNTLTVTVTQQPTVTAVPTPSVTPQARVLLPMIAK
jgi:DNA-binding beta-propeller fold protein YncE